MATITDLKVKVDTSELVKAIELLKEYKQLTEAPVVSLSIYNTERDFDFSGSFHDKINEALNKNLSKDKQ